MYRKVISSLFFYYISSLHCYNILSYSSREILPLQLIVHIALSLRDAHGDERRAVVDTRVVEHMNRQCILFKGAGRACAGPTW